MELANECIKFYSLFYQSGGNHKNNKPKPRKRNGASAGLSATLMQCLPALLLNNTHSKEFKKTADEILDSTANKNQWKIAKLSPSRQAAMYNT